MTVTPPWHPHAALSGSSYSAAELSQQNDRVFLLEQRELPVHETYHTYMTVKAVAGAIKTMVVRGAPAIGITAAYGMVLAAYDAVPLDAGGYLETMRNAGEILNASRPTAVNLAWAVKKCMALADAHAGCTALVALVDDARGSTLLQRHVQHRQHQLGRHLLADGPAHDPSVVQDAPVAGKPAGLERFHEQLL